MQTANWTSEQARHFLVAYHGLDAAYTFEGKSGIMQYIAQVGCIQYDPLNIVGRNPELVLQSRIEKFRPELLQQLLYQDRLLVDGWDKVMSIYPIADWPYFRRFREQSLVKYGRIAHIEQAVSHVRESLTARGPLSSAELGLNEQVMWDWGVSSRLSRAVLESMYWWGELIIHHKKNNQKSYDLAERHLAPDLLHAPEPHTEEEAYTDWRVLRRIGGIGLLWDKAGDAWVGLSYLKAAPRRQSFERLWQRGLLTQIYVEGLTAPLYARTQDAAQWMQHELERQKQPESAARNRGPALRASILAPLDNLLWDRRLIKALFGFEYTWEVYKPAQQREYGYYVLPILYGDKLIARFEPGKVGKHGGVQIKNWWWEPDAPRTASTLNALRTCFRRFSQYLGAEGIEIDGRLAKREGLERLLS